MPERERTADKRVAIVLPQTSLRETVHQILRNVAGLKMSMVLGPTDVANASREVGCIHTVQGYDLNYVGVIIGPEINPQGGRLRLSAYLSACIPVHDPGKSGRFRSADPRDRASCATLGPAGDARASARRVDAGALPELRSGAKDGHRHPPRRARD